MAILPNLQLSGKHGGKVYYVRNGKQCARIMPKEMKNPRTPAQMKNRNQFGATSLFASAQLKTLIHPFWNPVAKKNKRTGYNYFVQSNLPAFKNGIMTAEKLILCPENGLVQENFVVENFENSTRLSWKERPDAKSAREEDELCLMILSEGKELSISNSIAKREDYEVEIVYQEEKHRYYYAFWKRDKYCSESRFLFAINS